MFLLYAQCGVTVHNVVHCSKRHERKVDGSQEAFRKRDRKGYLSLEGKES